MRWLLCGATGRMGRETARLIAAGGEEAVAFDARTAESGDVRGDVMVDFSVPEATEGNLAAALRLGCPLVLGTTGQGPREAEMIGRAAEKIPILWCANFSRGAALLAQLAATACAGWEGESALVEQHRAGKRDCPSGTAEMIGKSISLFTKGEKTVPIVSLRGGDAVGRHELILCGGGEVIRLSHEAVTREPFARGAIAAGRALVGRPAGLYRSLDEIGL